MDNENTQNEKKDSKMTTIGGQALMEGLMMIGPKKLAMAVRLPSGEIHVEQSPIGKSSKAAKIPFVRGSVKIFRQLVTGTKYLLKSAEFAEEKTVEDETDMDKKKPFFDRLLEKHGELALYLSAILGLLLSVGLFILLPNLISNLSIGLFLDKNLNVTNRILHSVSEGIIRISIFLIYLTFASKLKEISRVWMYHGAEHKTIACYESNLPLTVENTRQFSKHHPRCGTAFMFIILIISIIMFSFVPRINIFVDLIIRLSLVPLLAGISYEVIHFSARHDNIFTRLLSKPGLWLQRLTTKEPDDDMLEVAIAAMMPVIPEDKISDEW